MTHRQHTITALVLLILLYIFGSVSILATAYIAVKEQSFGAFISMIILLCSTCILCLAQAIRYDELKSGRRTR